tara:strand:+ start:698 stop:1024 length:327 start_codon:yes stop_codon:yes gene_type:complete
MKYPKVYLIFILLLFLNSCGTIKEGFSNQKKNNSDEFLVEKKSPLVMPPDYDKLPLPKNGNDQNESDKDNFKDLVMVDTQEDQSKNKEDDRKNNQNFEETILEKIKKN